MSKIIRGAKGRASSRQPERAEDTLNSKEFATVQDLVSEGEIEGFATPSLRGIARNNANYNNACLTDIFLNDSAVLNINTTLSDSEFADKLDNLEESDFSFQDVTFVPRFGEENQTDVKNVENAVFEKISTAVSPTHSNPISKATGGTNSGPSLSPNLSTGKDGLEITITFDALQEFKDNGDIEGAEVQLKIFLQVDNGLFVEKIDDTIKGRSADPYSKEYRINLPNTYSQARVKVTRETDDRDPDVFQDTFAVVRMEEIVDGSQSYPNCAYSTLRLSSQQFRSIPERAFRIRGIKVRIPGAGANNSGTPSVVRNQADADALQLGTVSSFGFIHYPDGYIFNGTMGAAQWCSDPAMVLLDVMTNHRYGLGDQIAPNFDPDNPSDVDLFENIDLYSYFNASHYASALIEPPGQAKEPRFSCNVSIQGSGEAFSVINELAGVMRAFPVWQSGELTLSQDRETDASFLFSLSNVGEEGFSYSGSSLRQRHSVVSVGYFNMDSREIDYEVVEDDVAIEKFGRVIKRIKAFACTSRTQARRLGKAVLFSEQQESEVVTFTTSIDAGGIVRPGSVIKISDPVRSGVRRSGRIKTATTTAITVDNIKDLSGFAGSNPRCFVMLPSGIVEDKPFTISGNVINLGSALTEEPNDNSIWMLTSESQFDGQPGAVDAQTFRVINIEEKDDVNYTITALTYVDGKYANIEQDEALTPRTISLLNVPKAPPTGLGAVEKIVVINNLAVSKIIVSWEVRTGVSQYLVQYRFNNTNWVSETVFRPDIEILNSQAGTYEIKVFSYNAAFTLSTTSTNITFNAKGKSEIPGPVRNLSYEPIDSKDVRLRWDLSTDPDVIHGGRVYVRHSTQTDGQGTFQNSVDLIKAIPGNSTSVTVPLLEGEYILKFQDDGGRFSTEETSVIVDLPDLIDSKIVMNDREDTDLPNSFAGNKRNTVKNAGGLELEDVTVVKSGTYSQVGKIITCTITNHGIQVGEFLKFNFSGGEAEDLDYTVASVQNANTLTVVADRSVNTSGSVSIDRGLRGFYDFAVTLDLGAIFSVNFRRIIKAFGFGVGGQLINGLYTQSGTIVTITALDSSGSATAHGRSAGDYVNFTPSSGSTSGVYKVISNNLTTTSFQIEAVPSATVSSATACIFNFVNTIDTLIPAGSFWNNYATDGNFDGPAIDDVSAFLSVSITQDDPGTGSPIYSNYQTFANGTYKGRGFKFRCTLESGSAANNVNVQELGVIAEFESRTERSHLNSSNESVTTPIDSGTSVNGVDVTFANPFFTGTTALGNANTLLPSIGITIANAASGEYFVIKQDSNGNFLNAAGANINGKGFNLIIKNSNNQPVNKKFTFQAVGYGKGV
tara:strand:+ start:2542 stop:6588 length:4047 start_codon:yes stop_codon:yes gene_type:complete